MHVACFTLLIERVGGETPWLHARLHDICASIPITTWGLPYIDHDYEDMLNIEDELYPWQDKIGFYDSDTEDNDYLYGDPLAVQALVSVVDETAEASAHKFLTNSVTKTAKLPSHSTSLILQLPWEIKEMIAINLSTRDAMALRLSVSEFLPLLHSHQFWKSRFSGKGQMSYFFEARHLRTVASLVSAHKKLSAIHDEDPGLVLSRQRVWKLLSHWVDLIKLELTSPMNILSIPPSAKYEWFSVSGNIGPEGKELTLPDGCKTLFGGRTAVRQQPLHVTVFLCKPGGRDYVRGLRLTWDGAQPVVLGYCNSRIFKTLTVKSFAGFVVAVGSKGIHALKLVDEDGTRSRWAGRPLDALVTERLSRRRPVLALDADFDVS
jgi:hypothetical protein